MPKAAGRTRAVLEALLVTLLWSTSWVLIKLWLGKIPALTFAGLRYALAFLCLLPFALRPQPRTAIRALTKRQWAFLLLLGVIFYSVTQGAQFASLAYLPAITTSLMLTFSVLVVALLGALFLGERPTWLQWVGAVVFLAGAAAYFLPVHLEPGQGVGLVIISIGVVANAVASVMGRSVNREAKIPPLVVTVISMGVGSLLLLGGGLAFQGMPRLRWQDWGVIGWLAVVNTAFAFTLWNRTLRTLSAFESSIINNTMLIQIAIMAWVFLGERPNGQEIAGLALAAAGALLVQVKKKEANSYTER